MFFSFWNNVSFPSPWQYYIPMEGTGFQTCTILPQTTTFFQESQKRNDEDRNEEKKGLIELSRDDLIDAGYETSKKLWSQDQDQLLLKLIDQDKIAWKQIQKYIPERTQKMCYSRYRRLLSQTKQSWTKEQDEKIKQLVSQHGQEWKIFTIHFRNRSSKQIKQRYTNFLRPQIKRDHWSLEEDLKIIQSINKYGKKWKQIEKELGNRTDNQIKNRYYGRLKLLYKNKLVKERRKNNQKYKKSNLIATPLPTASSLEQLPLLQNGQKKL